MWLDARKVLGSGIQGVEQGFGFRMCQAVWGAEWGGFLYVAGVSGCQAVYSGAGVPLWGAYILEQNTTVAVYYTCKVCKAT